MALDLHMKNGFRAISFEYIGVLDSYFIHRYIIIKYMSSSIMDKIHRFLSELWPFVRWQCPIYANLAIAGASVSHGHISSLFLSLSFTRTEQTVWREDQYCDEQPSSRQRKSNSASLAGRRWPGFRCLIGLYKRIRCIMAIPAERHVHSA